MFWNKEFTKGAVTENGGTLLANLQIHVKPQNEKSRKDFSKGKKGMTNQAGQRGIFANRLSRTIISG